MAEAGSFLQSALGKHYMGAFCPTCTTFQALHTSHLSVIINEYALLPLATTTKALFAGVNSMISMSRQFVHEMYSWRVTCKHRFSCVQESACSCVFTRSCYRCRGPELAPAPLLADTRAALAPHNHHHWLRTLGLESRGHLSPGLRHARICPALALERARAGRQS